MTDNTKENWTTCYLVYYKKQTPVGKFWDIAGPIFRIKEHARVWCEYLKTKDDTCVLFEVRGAFKPNQIRHEPM